MRVGDRAWSMQYHVELEPDTVDNWGKHTGLCLCAWNQQWESDGLATIKAHSDRNMDDFMGNARQLYSNFMKQVS